MSKTPPEAVEVTISFLENYAYTERTQERERLVAALEKERDILRKRHILIWGEILPSYKKYLDGFQYAIDLVKAHEG